MHGVLALMLALAPTLSGVQRSASGECVGSEPAVTVQIHIYSHVPSESLCRASDLVTRSYVVIELPEHADGAGGLDVRVTRHERE